MNTFERRLEIIKTISRQKTIHYRELEGMFDVSAKVISGDIKFLMEMGVPIETVRGRNGCVQIYGKWKLHHKYLSKHQEKALLLAMFFVPKKIRMVLFEILCDFSIENLKKT